MYILHDNKPVYRSPQQSIRRFAACLRYLLILFSALSAFAVGGLSIERNQKPLALEITLAVTHHDRQKRVEVKRSSRVNPHEIRLFSGCPYYHCDTEHCYLHCFPSIFLVTFFLYSTFFAHGGKKFATVSGCRFLLCGCLTSAYAVFRFGCCSGHFMPKWSSIALRVSDSALVVVPDFS